MTQLILARRLAGNFVTDAVAGMFMDQSNLQRLADAAHYVIARTEPEKLGATKLNKILWYADLEHYRRTGRSITGLRAYRRMPRGPVPLDIDRAIALLKRDGRIVERKSKVHDYERREFIWLKDPDLSIFSPLELDLINRFIDQIRDLSAAEISEITHEDELWKELENGDTMPIGAASIISREPTAAQLAWAQAVEAK